MWWFIKIVSHNFFLSFSYFNCQSICDWPEFSNILFIFEKCLHPKNPLFAESGLGCAAERTKCCFPVIRLNALPIEIPLNASIIDCEIGGNKDIREVIKQKHGNIAAIRRKEGVIGFGRKDELEKVFNDYKIIINIII